MISNLHIKNFKSLKDINLPLKNLNLFMGLNGMGKSSALQALLMLRQSRDLSKGIVSLNDSLVQIGRGKDAMYQFNNSDEDILIEITLSNKQLYNWAISYSAENQHLETQNLYDSQVLANCNLFTNDFQFLGAERTSPQDDYKMSSLEVLKDKQLGITGYYSAHFLFAFADKEVAPILRHNDAKSSILQHQIDAWMSEISPGVKLNTEELKNTEKLLLDMKFETGYGYTNSFKPKNVGFGITYVLPVLLSLLTAEKNKLVIIENPESHIHPKGQAKLGELIALSAANGAQLLIETHSDHMLNGVRVAVNQFHKGAGSSGISKDDVHIFYFEKETTESEQFTKKTLITLDHKGELSDYPKDFLDEWSNQLLMLL